MYKLGVEIASELCHDKKQDLTPWHRNKKLQPEGPINRCGICAIYPSTLEFFFFVNIISAMFRIYSFIYYQCCIFLAVHSAIKDA
jgi:hypothetical protein